MTTKGHDDETTVESTVESTINETVDQTVESAAASADESSTETTSTEEAGIEFSVETTDAVGEPVFPEEEAEAPLEASEETDLETDDEAEDSEDDELDDTAEFSDVTDEESLVETSSETKEEQTEGEATETYELREELTLAGKIESIVFASPKPMRAVEIHELLLEQGYTLKEIQDTCDELVEHYRDRAGGFHLKYIKRMGYQFQTTPAAKPLMEKQFSSRPRPLSRAALETLAVIAYRQKKSKGVTRAEVEFIRGVDAGSIFKTLVERNLLTCTGRKEIPGRPMMFGVTDEFLKIFQLGSINDLPPLESFQTPPDVLQAASDKIAAFEAEQEGVDTEVFIGDEEYTSEVMSSEEFNPLAAEAPTYAPTLDRLEEAKGGLEASSTDTAIEGELEKAQDLDTEESKADLIDVLSEGQVAWAAPDVHTDERTIEGATSGEVIQSLDAIDDEEWDDDVQVEMTATEAPETETALASEAQLDERDETSEMALPIGDSESPRGGEVDQ